MATHKFLTNVYGLDIHYLDIEKLKEVRLLEVKDNGNQIFKDSYTKLHVKAR